jgi:hypothetical protein
MRATAGVQKETFHFFMLLPTLFFTLQAYTLHVVMHVPAQPFKGGERSKDQHST